LSLRRTLSYTAPTFSGLLQQSLPIVIGAIFSGLPPASVTVLCALLVGTLIMGAALYLLGVPRAGRWIRFAP